MPWLSWPAAWEQALYGDDGFYRRGEAPAAHFATAAQGIPGGRGQLAAAIITWMDRAGWTTFVDVAAGRGELAAAVSAQRPDLRVLAVDVGPRPPELPAQVGWRRSPGGATTAPGLDALTDALAVANEWLDVVPCLIAEADETGRPREVWVDPATGLERLGAPLAGRDLAWQRRHWPGPFGPGERIEVGRARDRAWAGLTARIRSGAAVAIDYGHLRSARPRAGTLAGVRDGRATAPTPDGRCDLSAQVAMDSLPGARVADQATWLRALGVRADPPDPRDAAAGPAAYLSRLQEAGAAAALMDPAGMGAFLWAVTVVGPGA